MDNTVSIIVRNVSIKDILNVTDDTTYISNDVSLAKNVSVVDTIYASNIESADNTVSIIGSNVSIKDILNVTDDTTYISNDVSSAKNVSIENTLFTSNLQINGDLRILGEVHTIDTVVTLTEQFTISNDGTGPALEGHNTEMQILRISKTMMKRCS